MAIESASRISRARNATGTSPPAATRITSGTPPPASTSTYPPRLSPRVSITWAVLSGRRQRRTNRLSAPAP
ncbi:hypothetical protein ACFQ0T_21200 [Kitasatospora gansuensis]